MDPNDEAAVEALVKKWTEQLVAGIEMLHCPKENMKLFFEDCTGAKKRHLNTQGRTSKLNTALKRMYGPCPDYSVEANIRKGKSSISAVYGRPSWFITIRVAHRMKSLGYSVSACPDTESDWRICKWATQMYQTNKQVYVLSVDSDYLAFAPPQSVTHLASPQFSGISVVDKAELLKHSELSNFQLSLAFALAGSDNIHTKITGIGWSKAAKYVKQNIPKSMTAAKFRKNPQLPRLDKWKNSSKELVNSFINDYSKTLEKFNWFGAGPVLEPLPAVETAAIPAESELFRFSFELDKDGRLVRIKAAEYVAQHYAGVLDPHRLEKIRRLVDEEKAKAKELHVNKMDVDYLVTKPSESYGIHKVQRTGKYVTIPPVVKYKMLDLVNGPSFFPQWFEKCQASDLVKIQKEKAESNSINNRNTSGIIYCCIVQCLNRTH